MKIVTVAVLSAGLAFPAVVGSMSQKPRGSGAPQSREMKKGEKSKVLKKVKRGLLSAALFVAEPEK
jgi:hypothetical protein